MGAGPQAMEQSGLKEMRPAGECGDVVVLVVAFMEVHKNCFCDHLREKLIILFRLTPSFMFSSFFCSFFFEYFSRCQCLICIETLI